MKLSINWKKRLPFIVWMRHYSLSKLQRDAIAGLTVGVMVIPQGLAYASIAELPPQYGLYNAFMGGFIYCLLGSSKDITQGPTAIMSLMVATYSAGSPQMAIALSFYIGIIWLVMGCCSLGFIVRIMPLPVISSFSSVASITIACGQLKYILGLSGIPRNLFPCLIKIFSKIRQINPWDLILSTVCIVLLELLRQIKPVLDSSHEEHSSSTTTLQKVAFNFLWIVCTARNALIVLISSLVAFALNEKGLTPFTLTGPVKEGLPQFQFSELTVRVNNETLGPLNLIANVGVGFVVMPLIGFVENIVSAQTFAKIYRYEVDATQELLSLGVVNIANCFVSGYPVTGSFSRTAVNAASGVATQLGGIFTGAIVLLALSLLTPFFKYVPKSSLASIIITALLRVVDFRIVKDIWRTNRTDLLPYFASLFGCLYQLDVGILCGVAMAIIIFLYRRMKPEVEILNESNDRCYFKIHGPLTFAGVEQFTLIVEKMARTVGGRFGIVSDFSMMFECDFTVTEALLQLYKECSDRDITMIFYGVQKNVKEMLVRAGIPMESFSNCHHPNQNNEVMRWDNINEECNKLLPSPKTVFM